MSTSRPTPGQAWRPSSEVEFIVGTPPGGGQDRPARALIAVLQSAGLVTVPMRLANIPGAGGGHAWDALRCRAGDAHALAVSAAPLLTNRIMGVSDFDHAALTPVATLYTEYLAFIVRADSSLRGPGELLERLARPDSLAVAIATAIGTTNHIALGQVTRHAGGDPSRLRLRVFDSALKAVADVVEGGADAAVVSSVSAAREVEAGALRALAVSAPERMDGAYRATPTWTEQSVPCAIGQWRGVVGAPGISAAQVRYWEKALGSAVATPDWKAQLARNGWSGCYRDSPATRRFLDEERALLGTMLSALGLAR